MTPVDPRGGMDGDGGGYASCHVMGKGDGMIWGSYMPTYIVFGPWLYLGIY
jgi:hypothetical protein